MEFIKVLFDSVWQLFSIKWPGFDFSIGFVFLGGLLIVVALSMIGKIFDLSFDGGQRGGNNKKMKISKERQKDTK